jgi:hypothetical protein
MASREDHRAIAEIVSKVKDLRTRTSLAVDLAAYFKTDNPQFDQRRFYIVCNVREVKK